MSSDTSSNTPAKRQYEFPPQQDHIIQPSEDDVATSMLGDRVYVSAPGRKLFRHVWLWKTGYTKDTTTSFEPETHGPGVSKQSPLPDDTELQPHNKAMEMPEIGLVFASDPSRFHEEVKGQTSRSKSRQIARDKRGIMTRNDTWFRAYIKVTDYVQSQAKISVGCLLFDGHLRPITTEIGHVFFYKEFYPGASIENAKEKSAYMRQAIKFYSAKIKRPQPKPGAGETASMASQALVPEVAVAGDPMDCVQMEDQLPPHENDDGVSIFLAFDENITLDDEDMASLIEIVQPQIGMPSNFNQS
ncbi:uncharacterized protein FIESC28_05448 [Fusarium coffeatum]|uniref:Uncharacterized protein n=1 Tax=Fusarium coffeatum TaxID=231269 RepID=A0A366RSN6_9HYPO|nr:uncharacterized protein FIESC28_05448 [Fusarium coffeatum]RBR19842.1 hypothetical protein FIESC28_05448 [Fusarium coffeatum]